MNSRDNAVITLSPHEGVQIHREDGTTKLADDGWGLRYTDSRSRALARSILTFIVPDPNQISEKVVRDFVRDYLTGMQPQETFSVWVREVRSWMAAR